MRNGTAGFTIQSSIIFWSNGGELVCHGPWKSWYKTVNIQNLMKIILDLPNFECTRSQISYWKFSDVLKERLPTLTLSK